MNRAWLGSAELRPTGEAMAGSMGTWTLIYTIGRLGVDEGGSIRIARRSVCDSERPQFVDPKGSGYTIVNTTGGVRLVAKYDEKGHIRPWKRALQIDIYDGSLKEGDIVVVTFGDRGCGGPGIRMQTFRESEHIFKVYVDCFGTGRFEELEGSPILRISGGQAERLQVAATSNAIVGRPMPIVVRVLDRWGNPSEKYLGMVEFSSSDPEAWLPEAYRFTSKDYGAKIFRGVLLGSPGVHTISILDESGRTARSNPFVVHRNEPDIRLFWGDMHGQTKETTGTGTLDEYFRFLRDVAMMDFGGWQGNDLQVSRDLWFDVCEATSKFNEPGCFITFLGYEWSGTTPAGGDHNIYYLRDKEEIYRSSHWLVDDRSDEHTDRYPITELWKTLHEREGVMAVAHVGGRYANLDHFDDELVRLIEVHSHHGTFEWFLEEAMKRGLRVGFVANSDDHTCRPGLTYPLEDFETRGGYTGVYASGLTRDALWEALWSRRCYATTGERMVIWVDVNGRMMGEEFDAREPAMVSVRILGTNPLQEVEIKRGTETIYRHPFAQPRGDQDRLVKIEWSGVRVRGKRYKVDWDGGLTLNSGRIISYSEFAFDHPNQGITKLSDRRLEWSSSTGGDPDGVLLKIDAPSEAEITFFSKPVTFTFMLSDITYEPMVVDAGGLNQRVKVSAITEGELPSSLEFSYVDNNPQRGVNPYWIRVVQSDGNMAWTSPVYTRHREG